MELNKHEFHVLVSCYKDKNVDMNTLADKLDCSASDIENIYQRLTERGLIDNGCITSRGIEALAHYRVENAIIMAAGFSSRFAPLSYETPKGLLNVRGEILIERQIRQLQEAGINEIIVVAGYKKELFFYLEEKFGVKVVVNHEYASRNNNSTLMVVRKSLGNSYICSSDNYFTTNPFSPYEWKACYSAELSCGPTKEWCIQTNDDDLITSVEIGGSDAWYMIGHAYFDRAFSQRFVEILEAEYDYPATAYKLWETIYLDHIDELEMVINRCKTGTIFEFDSLDELREFDPLFLENIESAIFDNIVSVLGCTKTEIHDVYPLTQGLTNLSCHFATNSGEYVYRHPGIGTEKMIDRQAEVAAQQLAKRIGIDNTFIFENPDEGWKFSHFISNAALLDPHDPDQVKEAAQMARALHAEDVTLDREFDYLAEGKKYEALLLEKGPIEIDDYQQMANDAARLKAFAEADGAEKCLTHNDFFNLNLLRDSNGKLNLIDWEYAGMSDYASDYGTFVVTCMLEEDEADNALAYYFGRTPSVEELRHNYAYVALAGWCWYVWALQKESEGDCVGEWLEIYYQYAKRYSAKALALYEQGQ